jgi:flagellar biosynthesis chaperone FliJ
MLPAFLDKMRTERDQLIKKTDECLLLIHQLQNVLFEKFVDFKRLESYENKRQLQVRYEEAFREQQDIDEVATNLYRQKKVFH